MNFANKGSLLSNFIAGKAGTFVAAPLLDQSNKSEEAMCSLLYFKKNRIK
jgi:hypothetical protein